MDLSRQLQDALTKESLIQKNKGVQNKITIEQLVSMSEHFRYIYIVFIHKFNTYSQDCAQYISVLPLGDFEFLWCK